jgi:hypothetical protein
VTGIITKVEFDIKGKLALKLAKKGDPDVRGRDVGSYVENQEGTVEGSVLRACRYRRVR